MSASFVPVDMVYTGTFLVCYVLTCATQSCVPWHGNSWNLLKLCCQLHPIRTEIFLSIRKKIKFKIQITWYLYLVKSLYLELVFPPYILKYVSEISDGDKIILVT